MSLERARNLGWPAWAAIALALGGALALLGPGLIRVEPADEAAHGPALPPMAPAAASAPQHDLAAERMAPPAESIELFDASQTAVATPAPPGPAAPADEASPPADTAPAEDALPPVAAAPTPESVPATELLGIEATAGVDGQSLEILLRANGTISSPRVFGIDAPDRLVVDLEKVANAMGRNVVKLDAGRVTRVRSGMHEDTLRLVFDAGDVESAFEPRRIEPMPDGLRIRLGRHAARRDQETNSTGEADAPADALAPVASLAPAPTERRPTTTDSAASTEPEPTTTDDAAATDREPTKIDRAAAFEPAPKKAERAAALDEAHPPVASIMPSDPRDEAVQNDARSTRAHSPLPSYLNGPGAAASGAHDGLGLDGSYDCIIEPYDVVEVGSALTAVVHSVAVERSDFVEAGQVLAELESSPERAAVEVARARAAMDAEMIARQARMELSRKKQKRADQLFESQTLSADLRDEIRTEAEVAKAVLEEAREAKRLTELEYREAIERLDEHTIYSPISGVVIDRLKSPGEVVKEETIIVVAQIDPLRVEVILPAAAIGTVERGMRAEVFPEIPKAGVQVASVTVVDRVIDATSGTFGVRLELPNPDGAVPSGLRCQVRFLPVD